MPELELLAPVGPHVVGPEVCSSPNQVASLTLGVTERLYMGEDRKGAGNGPQVTRTWTQCPRLIPCISIGLSQRTPHSLVHLNALRIHADEGCSGHARAAGKGYGHVGSMLVLSEGGPHRIESVQYKILS